MNPYLTFVGVDGIFCPIRKKIRGGKSYIEIQGYLQKDTKIRR